MRMPGTFAESKQVSKAPGEPADFSAADLGDRWQRARLAALESVVAVSDTEQELLEILSPEFHEQVLRAVFDNSRKLGRSHARHFGIVWELADFREILSQLPIPCLAGNWETRANAVVLTRPGCQKNRPSAFYCDYWREAIDGLVMGASEDERFVRHASRGHGAEQCIDVYFKDSAPLPAIRHAPIPEIMRAGLADVSERCALMRARVDFKGISEGTLYYILQTESGDQACGAGGKILHEHLRKMVQERWPGLALQDASPLAVYGENA